MVRFVTRCAVAAGLMCLLASDSLAVRVMTNPATVGGDPALQFDNIVLTLDGATIVATGLFDPSIEGDRVYSLTVPMDPSTETATLTQLSTGSFLVNNYDVAFAPVISPNGQTILFVHDGNMTAQNTIYKMPITGEGNSDFTGLFGVDPNVVSPGNSNLYPIYSPDGSTIYFLNNNSGFGGSIPIFSTSPVPFSTGPDWDQIYSVPAGGGTPVAVTAPGDGDIDGGLFALTPDGASIVYAPAQPVIEGKDRSGVRTKLFSIPTTGGTPTEIVIASTDHDFTIKDQLATTPDGQHLFFIADYETVGKNELFSVPIAGGTPTRINDDLHFAGDVYSFAMAPDGTSVAYVAGQNVGSNAELFLTPITGGTGNSVRVSSPAPMNSGVFDVSTSGEGGQVQFSPDSSQIYYLGDLDTDNVTDLYVVDTTAKTGLVPSAYTFIGPSGGDFFDEDNWEDTLGNNPPADSINPAVPIRHTLIIDGDTVGTSGGEADFQVGGSLELTPGSLLDFPNSGNELDFNPGSALKLTDATIRVFEDIFLEGTNYLVGGLIESTGDDVEFQDGHETFLNGTTIRSAIDGVFFDNSATSITGATFDVADRLGLRYEVDVTVTDTMINVRGMDGTDPGGSGQGDVEDAFAGPQAEGSTLTLNGASTLLANAIQEGIDLVLDGTSVATLLGDPDVVVDLVDPNGEIIFMSKSAKMTTLHASASDVRARVINGLTGMSYLDDPSAWNIANWDGLSTVNSLMVVSGGLDGDFNGDKVVDAADYVTWRIGFGTIYTIEHYNTWRTNFGMTSGIGASSAAVPEPSALCLAAVVSAMTTAIGRSWRRSILRET